MHFNDLVTQKKAAQQIMRNTERKNMPAIAQGQNPRHPAKAEEIVSFKNQRDQVLFQKPDVCRTQKDVLSSTHVKLLYLKLQINLIDFLAI